MVLAIWFKLNGLFMVIKKILIVNIVNKNVGISRVHWDETDEMEKWNTIIE